MDLRLEVSREALDRLCRRYHVRRLALFGSVLREEDFGAESDLDVLVEFEPGHTPGLAFVRLQRDLSELLGYRVDLHTYRSLIRNPVVEYAYAKETRVVASCEHRRAGEPLQKG
jgi:predicted nucleotidyltransferase